VLTHGSNPKSIEFTPEELQAAVDEARNFGLRVEAHAHAAEGIECHPRRSRLDRACHAHDDEGIALARSMAPTSTWIFTMRNASRTPRRKNKTPADSALNLAQLAVVFQEIRRCLVFLRGVLDAFLIVNIHVEVGAMLLGKGDAFVVNERGMLDRGDSGADGILNASAACAWASTRNRSCGLRSTAACNSSGVNSIDFGLLPWVSTARSRES